MISKDFARMGMPCSVPALGTGSMCCPNSASLQPVGRWAPREQQIGTDGCSGARRPACPWVMGPMPCLGIPEHHGDRHTVPGSAGPCFGFASASGDPLCMAAAELCRGARKQPCTPTCRGGITAILRLLTQTPVCRSHSHPQKPQAKSPHPCARAFPAGLAGIAAFSRSGGRASAGGESLRGTRENCRETRDGLCRKAGPGVAGWMCCTYHVSYALGALCRRERVSQCSPRHPTSPDGGGCHQCSIYQGGRLMPWAAGSKVPPLFVISNPTLCFFWGQAPHLGSLAMGLPLVTSPLPSSGNGKFL